MFDTQVAAGFAGTRGPELLRLAAHRRCWGCGWPRPRASPAGTPAPLSAEQVAYAREDVVHLLELADELEGRLQELGQAAVGPRGVRAPVARSSDERDPEAILRRLPRVSGPQRPRHRRRTRAGGMARVRRRAPEPSRPGRPERRRARRARPPQPLLARGPGADPRPRRGRRRPPRSRAARGRPARAPSGPPDSVAVSAPRRPPRSPTTRPWWRSREALVRARARGGRAGLRAAGHEGRAAGDRDRRALGATRPTCARSRAGGATVAGAALLDLLAGRSSLTVSGRGSDARLRIEPVEPS